uniref:Cyclin C-terminal domain-containing protein n=1 Tax=Amblyomma tuberculatum TaxID=48802 RepID=A0A6M2E736_9ACAR
MLVMAPSQIALTAVLYAANKAQANFETYITDVLFANSPREKLHHVRDTVKKLYLMVRGIEVPPKDRVRACEQKLEKCRNQENNPDSQAYKRKMQDGLDEDQQTSSKYSRISEEHRQVDDSMGGSSALESSP